MYSIAQQAVAKGYGKIEYLRAQPMARSSLVTTTASPRSASSPDVARRGRGGVMGLAMDALTLVSADPRRVKGPHENRHTAGDLDDETSGGVGHPRGEDHAMPVEFVAAE